MASFICPATNQKTRDKGCVVHGHGCGGCGPTMDAEAYKAKQEIARATTSKPAPEDLPRCCPTCKRPWEPT